jgi:hypothetical protein
VSSIKRYIKRYEESESVAPTLQGRKESLIKDVHRAANRSDGGVNTKGQVSGILPDGDSANRDACQHSADEPLTAGLRFAEKKDGARRNWLQCAQTLPARRIVVIDESSIHLDMLSNYARVPRGQRHVVRQCRNWGKNMTLSAGLNLEGISTSMVVEGSVATAVFEAFIEQVLLSALQPGDIILLDNLAAHKSSTSARLLHSHGCQLLFLIAYSPDFSQKFSPLVKRLCQD